MIDFKRTKDGIPAKVERIEYDPNRTAHIALLLYADGERRYIIAPKGVQAGRSYIPVRPRQSRLATACLSVTFPWVGDPRDRAEARQRRADGAFGWCFCAAGCPRRSVRHRSLCAPARCARCQSDCRATLGEVSNSEHSLRKLGKAGAARWRGVRPTVRGVAMNPVDHPHGGGEGQYFRWSSSCVRLGVFRPRATRPERTSAPTA